MIMSLDFVLNTPLVIHIEHREKPDICNLQLFVFETHPDNKHRLRDLQITTKTVICYSKAETEWSIISTGIEFV